MNKLDHPVAPPVLVRAPRLFNRHLAFLALTLGLGLPVSAATPNDPKFAVQWYLKRIGAPAAWEVTTGSKDVVVAVIDTGVDYNNPDLAANLWRNPGETGLDANGNDKATNGIDDDGDGYIDDVYGINVVDHNSDPMDRGFIRGSITSPYTHGTACAGVIGAVGNNSTGTAGVNWKVSILAIRAVPLNIDRDWHDRETTAGFIEAFQYVLRLKRRGVNIVATSTSWAMAPYSQALKDVIDACGKEGIINVVSAGNNGMNNDQVGWYFGGYNSPSILCVAASLQDDSLASWSCYGRSTVHLAAPGLNIATTGRDDFEGTSAACPQVAGAIALLKSASPDASAADLKAAILGSVDQPPSMSGKLMSNGRLNVAKALARLTNAAAPAIVITALPAGPRTRPADPILITFSRPMNRASVEAATSFTPPIGGRFEWETDNRTVTFVPELPLVHTNYTATILGSALDATGGSLDGNFDGAGQGAPGDDFKWTFSFPVPNDDFVDALPISGARGSRQGTTRNATPEVDEPDIANNRDSTASVWFRWTAPATGWFTFDTLKGTTFDTLLGVYTGDALGSLREVSSSDNHGTSIYSRTSFAAQDGAAYSIAVAAKSYEADKFIIDETRIGPFTLNWYPTPTPGFTASQFFPTSGTPGTKVTLSGTNLTGATAVWFNGISAPFTNALTNNLDFRISAAVPPDAISGPITILTPHGNVTSTVSFQVPPPALSVTFSTTSGIEIEWLGTSSTWTLEASEDFSQGLWTPMLTSPLRTNGVTTVQLPGSAGNHFYRLKQATLAPLGITSPTAAVGARRGSAVPLEDP